ncbi:MAG: hypothetical protein KGI94_05625, partial [Paracoccaceae bacterium]|nr:hypothetical protein [Paracoccaceae bacterium]
DRAKQWVVHLDPRAIRIFCNAAVAQARRSGPAVQRAVVLGAPGSRTDAISWITAPLSATTAATPLLIQCRERELAFPQSAVLRDRSPFEIGA